MPMPLLLLLQVADRPAAPQADGRRSILADPCAAAEIGDRDVLVCGRPDAIAPRLPLPAERHPDGPIPSNPDLRASPSGPAQPCAASMWGCTVGFGPPTMATLAAGAKLVGEAVRSHAERRARARDGVRRVAIPMDDAPVSTAGKVLP